MMLPHNISAQIFPMSSILLDKTFPYHTTQVNRIPVGLMDYSESPSNSSIYKSKNTTIFQPTKVVSSSKSPRNTTTVPLSSSWNATSNFKSKENALLTASSNDQVVTAEPWARKYEDVYYVKTTHPRHMPQKVRKLKSKYDQVAYVYPPPSPHPLHQNHFVIMKPYEAPGEMHKLDLNPLIPPANEVTIDYYVTSSPAYFDEPEETHYPPGVENINLIDTDTMHTKKYYSKNVYGPPVTPLPTSIPPHSYHPYPFYNQNSQQHMYVNPTPSYPPVKKFIATVRPIYASPPSVPVHSGHPHKTHIVKYTTPTHSQYHVLPTLVEPISDSQQPLLEQSPVSIMGPPKSKPPAHDIFIPPRIPPLFNRDYHYPYSTVSPYRLLDLKHNRNLLKEFNRFLNQKEKRKKKRKKNEADSEDEDKTSKEDYENYDSDGKNDKEDDTDDDDDDDFPRKRKLEKQSNRQKNNKIEESKLETVTRMPPRYRAKIKKYEKDPYSYAAAGAYEKYYPSIPKNHKKEIEFGSWEKKGMNGNLQENRKLFDEYKHEGSNRVDVQHVSNFLLSHQN